MSPLNELAVVLCRLWTSIYTCGMDGELRAARRREIESDLWECQTDEQHSEPAAASLLIRLLLGMPHDVLWRMEYADRRMRARHSIAAAAGAAAVLALTVLWIGFSLLNPELPEPAPAMHFIAAPHPPPPPPPPPPDWYLKQDAQVARERSHGIDR